VPQRARFAEVALLNSGEEAQFWLFYRATSEALHRKAYRMCRGNEADADDAHPRTYLQALKHWGTTEVPQIFRTGIQ
jgi:DNA-directed RNA polymerase specialized sigma24 family protein